MAGAIFLLIIGVIIFALTTYFVGKLQRWWKRKFDPMRNLITDIPDFTPALRFDQGDCFASLLLDPEGHQFAIWRFDGEHRKYEFDQLVAVEIERNGSALELTNRGSQAMGAAVGGALLGPVGLLIGGLTGSKRQEERIKTLVLKIYTNDLHNPVSRVTFFKHPGGRKADAPEVQAAIEMLEDWYGRFRTILAAQAKSASPQPPNEPAASNEQSLHRRRGLLSEGG